MLPEVARELEEKAKKNALKPKSADDLIRIVKGFDCDCYLLGMPDGVEYGFTHEEDGDGIEVFDPVEADDYRHEVFKTLEDAVSKFLVDGKPLSDYWADVKVVQSIHDC